MITLWTNVSNLGLPTTILGDINVDRLEENDPKSRADLKNLIPKLKTFQNDKNFSSMNTKATRYRVNQRPTLLDLIITNKPETISNIKNVSNHCSEHMGVICTVKIEESATSVQFVKTRKNWLLTKETQMPLIYNNVKLQEIFCTGDPNKIANILTDEMDEII